MVQSRAVERGNREREVILTPHEEEFQSILGAAKAGADWAWADLYRELAGPVTGYLRSRGSREPEDLTSEVFLSAARAIHDFSGDSASFDHGSSSSLTGGSSMNVATTEGDRISSSCPKTMASEKVGTSRPRQSISWSPRR